MPTVTKLQYLMSWEWEWSESWFLLILLCSLATQRESAGGNSTNKETRETNLGEVLQKANSVEPDVSEQCVGGAMIVWKVGTRKGTTAGDYNEEETHHKMATKERRFSVLTQKFFVYVRLLSQQQGELEEQQQHKDNLEQPMYFWHCPLQTKCKYII